MTISSRNRKHRVFLVLILCSFIVARLCFRRLPNVFEMANAQPIDQLYFLRVAFTKFWVDYDPTVLHTNSRILLAIDEPAPAGELYAQVTPGSDGDAGVSSGITRLRFSWVPEEAKQFLANKHDWEFL